MARVRASRLTGSAALLVALVGCTAPGMKLNEKPHQVETKTFDQLKVTLRPLTPDLIIPPRMTEPVGLKELMVEKVEPYRVAPQDVLLVTVWDHPEITLPLGQFRTDTASGTQIDDDGSIFFPYIGKVVVNGLTVPEIRTRLTQQLDRVLKNPQVDVKVLAFRSQKVYIGGEVRNPATYPVTDVPLTLSEAIARSGGFNPQADDSRLILVRGNKKWALDFQALMTAGSGLGQIVLKDGDALYVSNVKESPVYVMGEVVRPGTLPLVHGSLSLAQALSDSGGIQGQSADARSIYVIRPTSVANAVDVFHLDARNPTAMVLADRFLLGPRDIVYVDPGTLVRFNRVMGQLLPTISAVSSTALSAAEIRYFRNR